MVFSARLFLFLILSYTYILFCSAKMEGYVVGGKFVNISEVPYAAYLRIKCKTTNGFQEFSCGSTILNQRILVSAAHCFETCLPSSTVNIITGSKSNNDKPTHTAESFVFHPHYNIDTVNNDISLIKLATPLIFGPTVERVMIMKANPAAKTAFLSGWGLVNEHPNNRSKFLKGTEQAIVPNVECENLLKNVRLPHGTFCATGVLGTDDFGYAAKGDSGSGLVVNHTILMGIVSFKVMDSTHITVFTDVSYHHDWIAKTALNLYCGK